MTSAIAEPVQVVRTSRHSGRVGHRRRKVLTAAGICENCNYGASTNAIVMPEITPGNAQQQEKMTQMGQCPGALLPRFATSSLRVELGKGMSMIGSTMNSREVVYTMPSTIARPVVDSKQEI